MYMDKKGGIAEHNIRIITWNNIFLGMVFVVPVWVAYELQYLTMTQFALIEVIIMSSQLLLELPTGAVADIFGRKFSVTLGRFITAAGLFVYLIARSFPAFIIYALLTGLGAALESGAAEALLYDSLKEDGREGEFDKVISRVGFIFQISLAAAIITGGILGSVNIMIPIVLYMAVWVVSGFISLKLIEPHVDSVKFSLKSYVSQIRTGVGELTKNPAIKDISLFYVMVGGITWVCQMVFNMTIITEIGHTALEAGIVLAVVRLLNSAALFKAIGVGNFLTPKRVYIMFPVFMTLALIPGILLGKWIVFLAVALLSFSSSARWQILGKYTNEHFSSSKRATAVSALSMGVGILYTAIVLLSGPVMDNFGGAKAVFTLLGVLSLFTILPLGIKLSKQS